MEKMGRMTAAEKQEAQLKAVSSERSRNDFKFQSAEAEAKYKANITRIKDAIQMKKADRVPVVIFPSMFLSFRRDHPV